MKRFLLIGALLFVPTLCFCTENTVQVLDLTQNQTNPAYELAVRIEPLSEEQTKAGLTVDMLRNVIADQLQTSTIVINDTMQHPTLVLRIRTLQVGLDMATFFQLTFMEEAMLVRNRSLFDAPTWSQASLLSCRPEDLKKEALDTLNTMVQAFAKDYVKAMHPSL